VNLAIKCVLRTNMVTSFLYGSFLAAVAGIAAPVDLMPPVAEVEWASATPLVNSGVVLLSDQASAPEREAARLLCRYVERRFGQKWTIQAAGEAAPAEGLRVYLGQVKTFPELARLCEAQKLTVPVQLDGYALKVWSDASGVKAIVAGMNGRSVSYGQDTLFQLLAKRDGKLTIQAATSRDWPGIPLRGRPHPHYQYFLKAENFDCIMSSRINFIDLRDGIYAFEPGAKLNKEELGKVVRDARDRGLRVYAAVNTGVPKSEQDAVLATFKEFIGLGADGLWLSFDDKGSGEDPKGMVARVLALGQEYQITGDAIAVTPPKGAYQVIDYKFNREVVSVPGMEQAVWYWTSVPCAEDAAAGEKIGLKVRPSWWHNWPRLHYPSLSSGPRAYVPVLDMADGWNHPSDQELKEMGSYVHAILPWDGWQALQHYLVPVIGWWSWRPEQYDKAAIRRRVYNMVFGPTQVESARAFDDSLQSVHDRFQFWSTQTDSAPACPPRLKSLKDRPRTIADLEALRPRLASLTQAAASASLLSPDLLREDYLEPMQREIATGLAAAQAPYLEYWFPEHQAKVLNAIYDGDMAKADQIISSARDRALQDVGKVEEQFSKLGKVGAYAQWWRKRASASAADWKQLLAQRQSELRVRIADYNKTIMPAAQMLRGLSDPPVQAGTGAWEGHNKLLATVVPEPREIFWGDWIGGVHKEGAATAAVFALSKHERVNANSFCELPVNLPVSGRRDRLAVLLYLADINKESFGLGYAKWRWSGYRSLRLLWNEQELWKADVGIPRPGGEWFVIPVPPLAADLKTLPLRIRVEDYRPAKNNLEIIYVGPVRLLELDQD
jgi:hypothetical protein